MRKSFPTRDAQPRDRLPRSTPRLTLRRLSSADLRQFQSYRGDPNVGRYQGWSAMDDAAAAAFLDAMANAAMGVAGEWFQMAIADRLTDALVGDIGVCVGAVDPATAEIDFTIAPAAQARGLGTEAVSAALALLFETGTIDRVAGITDIRNTPSIRLLERVGMRLLRKRDAVCKGETCREHVYEIARPDSAPTAQTRAL